MPQRTLCGACCVWCPWPDPRPAAPSRGPSGLRPRVPVRGGSLVNLHRPLHDNLERRIAHLRCQGCMGNNIRSLPLQSRSCLQKGRTLGLPRGASSQRVRRRIPRPGVAENAPLKPCLALPTLQPAEADQPSTQAAPAPNAPLHFPVEVALAALPKHSARTWLQSWVMKCRRVLCSCRTLRHIHTSPSTDCTRAMWLA